MTDIETTLKKIEDLLSIITQRKEEFTYIDKIFGYGMVFIIFTMIVYFGYLALKYEPIIYKMFLRAMKFRIEEEKEQEEQEEEQQQQDKKTK